MSRRQSGALILLALIAWLADWHVLQSTSLAIAAVIAGWPIAVSALRALRYRAFSIDLLVTIAVTGALIIGELVEAAVVAFLFVFGSWLEARTLERTRRSVSDLIDMAPEHAEGHRSGGIITVPVDEVAVGERVVVRTGSRNRAPAGRAEASPARYSPSRAATGRLVICSSCVSAPASRSASTVSMEAATLGCSARIACRSCVLSTHTLASVMAMLRVAGTTA